MTDIGRKPFDAARLQELAAAYGADFARWPASERAAAEAFLTASPESAHVLRDQEPLDRLLDGLPEAAPSPALLRSIAEIPVRHALAASEPSPWPFARLRQIFAVAIAAAAMGAALGVFLPDTRSADDGDGSWEDFSALASGVDLPDEVAP